MKYVKKPVVVEAFQLGVDDVPIWFFDDQNKTKRQLFWDIDKINFKECEIITLEGKMTAKKGDMIIKGIQGEIYPCKKDIFDASYEPYNENPVLHN